MSDQVTYTFWNGDEHPAVSWGPEHKKNKEIMMKRCAFVRFDLKDEDFVNFLVELANEEDGKEREAAPSFRRPQLMWHRPWFNNKLDGSVCTWERDKKHSHWSASTTNSLNIFGKPMIRWPYPGEDGYEEPSKDMYK